VLKGSRIKFDAEICQVHSPGGLNWKMDLPKPHSFTKMLGERPGILFRRQGIAYERIGKYHSGTIAYGCCRSFYRDKSGAGCLLLF
jgi:hypothetical protein